MPKDYPNSEHVNEHFSRVFEHDRPVCFIEKMKFALDKFEMTKLGRKLR